MIATITVLVSGLTIATSISDAEAKKDKHPPTGTHDLKCKENVGSFFTPSATGSVVSSSEAKCKFFGHTSFASITQISGLYGASGNHCLTLATTEDAYGISKKGFFEFSMTLEQCLYQADGETPIADAYATDFCKTSTDAWVSTVTGTYLITGGQLLDKKHGDSTVESGSGLVTSSVDHCAGSTAPHGNSAITEMTGTIVFPTIP